MREGWIHVPLDHYLVVNQGVDGLATARWMASRKAADLGGALADEDPQIFDAPESEHEVDGEKLIMPALRLYRFRMVECD
jgi:hypothetical protein